MATLTEQAQNYLYNLNSMTRKIHQDIEILRRNQNEDWDDLGEEKQEELLDKFFVDEAVKQKYATDSADGQDVVCFPKYVVNCGEKIVIDFDNDGWTWRDEHSAPFSWMSRSQQDLNFLDEDEDEGIEKDQAERKRKRTQKSKTPDRPAEGDVPGAGGGGGNLAFKPEKSIWESPFLAADRGLDSAYPSSHASDQSRTSDESDDMSQKLAASLSVSIDEDVVGSGVDSQLNSPGNNNDTSVLLDSDNHKTIDLHNVRMMTVGDLTRQGSASSEESTSSRGSQGKRKKDNSLVAKLWNPRKRKDGDQGFAGDADSPSSQGATSADSGQVSPVYLEDLGESSSDFAPSTSTTQSSMTTFTFSSSAREECDETPQAMAVVTSQPTSQMNPESDGGKEADKWESELFNDKSPSAVTKKTGFDFLDNW